MFRQICRTPAGRGHGAVSQSADIQHFIKSERGNVAKKGRVSTL